MCEYSGIKNIWTKYIYVLGACYNNDFWYRTFETPIWSSFLGFYVKKTDFTPFKIYSFLFLRIGLVWYGENRTYYPTHHKPKILIPDLYLFTNDSVLWKGWYKNYFMYRYVITIWSKNMK